MQDFNVEDVVTLIAKHKGELLSRIERGVSQHLSTMSPNEALGFRLLRGDVEIRRLTATASPDYAGMLIAFMRHKTYEGCTVDSLVTPQVMSIIEKETVSFYSSNEISGEISSEIVRQLQDTSKVSEIVQIQIAGQAEWLQKEFKSITTDSATSLSGTLIDASVSQVQTFLATSTGKAILAGVSKAAATTAGKVALQRTLMLVVQKVMASAALKASIMSAIKKVGIGVLIKTAIGKAVIALLALVGIAQIPVVWIILPLIAAFLVYEYNQFPTKLAKKVPLEVSKAVGEKFGPLNERIVSSILSAIFSILNKQMFDLSK